MLDSEIRQLISDVAFLREQNDKLGDTVSAQGQTIGGILNTQINTPAAPVANLLFNGEVGHSNNSWFDSAYALTDSSKEAAFWFSHDAGEGVTLSEVRAPTSSTNNTLKNKTHSTYSAVFSRWNSANGWAELTATKTVDALLPTNFIDATTTLARVSLIAAKRSPYIEIPNDSLMYAGIYDNSAGELKFLTGSVGFTANLLGGGAASTIERRFKLFVTSDRGFSILSPEITILNAPADGFFDAAHKIAFAWKQTAGQLSADIYEYVPSTGVSKWIKSISSSFSYIYDGNFLRTAAGYPVPTTSVRKAIYYTRTGEMSDLATNMVSPRWDTINFPAVVPDNYDKSVTTGRQWLRMGMTVAANLLVPNCTADGTTTFTAPAAVFDAEFGAAYVGLTAQIYDAAGTLLATLTVASRTDDTHIVLSAAVSAGTNLTLRIVGGGFAGIFIDKIHLGFQQNTPYAPNALDNRTLQPVAAPSASSQGGTGTGGTGGGINNCVTADTPIKQKNGERKFIANARPGDRWNGGELRPNLLLKLRQGFEFVRAVEAENGCYVECTDTERFVINRDDTEGTPLSRLRVGDSVLTETDGRIVPSKIVSISGYLPEKRMVYTPTLSNSRLFIAGQIRRKRGFWRGLWRKIFGESGKRGGFVLHNNKQDPV